LKATVVKAIQRPSCRSANFHTHATVISGPSWPEERFELAEKRRRILQLLQRKKLGGNLCYSGLMLSPVTVSIMVSGSESRRYLSMY